MSLSAREELGFVSLFPSTISRISLLRLVLLFSDATLCLRLVDWKFVVSVFDWLKTHLISSSVLLAAVVCGELLLISWFADSECVVTQPVAWLAAAAAACWAVIKSERSKSRSLGQQVSEASTDITVTKPLLSLLLTPQPLYRKCWGLPYFLFLYSFTFMSRFILSPWDFFHKHSPSFFLCQTPFTAFLSNLLQIDSMSRELKYSNLSYILFTLSLHMCPSHVLFPESPTFYFKVFLCCLLIQRIL